MDTAGLNLKDKKANNIDNSERFMDKICLLLVEDNPRFARLIKEFLSNAKNIQFKIVIIDTLSEALEYLKKGNPDIILLDLILPDSKGLDTFQAVYTAFPDIPVVIQTGLDDEELALEAVHKGAQDYIIKSEINEDILVRSMRYAIERQKLIVELKTARQQIKVLSGLLPICSYCKRIRDDSGYWKKLETYIAEHSEADFSHSICPECIKKYFPELYNQIREDIE
jgi:CheY-like chemotaxis protein